MYNLFIQKDMGNLCLLLSKTVPIIEKTTKMISIKVKFFAQSIKKLIVPALKRNPFLKGDTQRKN